MHFRAHAHFLRGNIPSEPATTETTTAKTTPMPQLNIPLGTFTATVAVVPTSCPPQVPLQFPLEEGGGGRLFHRGERGYNNASGCAPTPSSPKPPPHTPQPFLPEPL